MLTASVVLYHTGRDMMEKILNSFCPSKDRRLFLINNAPETDTLYREFSSLEGVEYVNTQKNLGYGRAHNIGIRRAIELNSDYHIVLNPDVYFEPRILDTLTQYADAHPEVVCILPKVQFPDERMQYLCKLLPTPQDLLLHRFIPKIGQFRAHNDRYILKDSGYDRIINAPCLSGCFMFIRTDVLKNQELLFDEQFFMYCEDVDLVRRLHRYGRTEYYPDACIYHCYGAASHKNLKMFLVHFQSAYRYFNKYGWFHDDERDEMNRACLAEVYREIEKPL